MRTRRLRPASLIILSIWLLPMVASGDPLVESVLDLSAITPFIGGIAYDPTTDHLFLADLSGDQVHEVNRADGALLGSWLTPGGSSAPVGLTYHAPTDHLLFVSETDNALYEVTKDGLFVASVSFSVAPASVSGCSFNALDGRLLVVDDMASNMLESLLDGTVTHVYSLLGLGIFDADAITYNSIVHTVFIGDDTGRRLLEVSTDATILLNIYDLSPAGLDTGGVEGLAFDAAGERLFLVNGSTRLLYEISGVATGGGVVVEQATWGSIKATFAR